MTKDTMTKDTMTKDTMTKDQDYARISLTTVPWTSVRR
jgi:hypothetical protein